MLITLCLDDNHRSLYVGKTMEELEAAILATSKDLVATTLEEAINALIASADRSRLRRIPQRCAVTLQIADFGDLDASTLEEVLTLMRRTGIAVEMQTVRAEDKVTEPKSVEPHIHQTVSVDYWVPVDGLLTPIRNHTDPVAV